MSIPASVFTSELDRTLQSLARPPTRRHAGTRLKSTKSIVFPCELLSEELSPEHGLPNHDPEVGLERTEEGDLVPRKTTSLTQFFVYKLQNPEHVKAFVRFEKRTPSRGSGATRLLLSKAAEQRGQKMR